MWATYKGRTDVVSLLLERGADVNAHGNYHISSLLWAAGRGNTQIVQSLISHGAKVNVGDKYGTTALVWASRKGHTEIVDCLLRAGKHSVVFIYCWFIICINAGIQKAAFLRLALALQCFPVQPSLFFVNLT